MKDTSIKILKESIVDVDDGNGINDQLSNKDYLNIYK